MCGFAAMVATNGARTDRGALERMNAVLRHRGPDDDGLYVSDEVALGFRRLAILDLSPAGHQPMFSPDRRAVIVFNGEIFNYVELRAELEAKGHAFHSTGDTEVLLAAYREWGRACLPRLNGMWAFLIYDLQNRKVFGSRDRFGIKPLYWHRARDTYLFGSEIKAIRASGMYETKVNREVLARYLVEEDLSAGDRNEATFYAGVEQIPPGTGFEVDLDGRWHSWRYWCLDDCEQEALEDPCTTFADLFEDSVKLRLRSDVPVGVCLSGGLDSTAILCSMDRQRRAQKIEDPLHAFCYMSPRFDETRYIEDTLAQTGANLNRIELKEALDWDRLQKIFWFYDQPVHSTTPLVGYELMGLAASKGVTVVLNGQGADETLAGYDSYFRDAWHTLLQKGRWLRAWNEIAKYGEAHERSARQLFAAAVQRAIRGQLRRSGAYRRLAVARGHAAALRSPWFDPSLASHLPETVPPYDTFTLRRMLTASVERDPLPLYLRVEDRNSMAHSLEARLPFMDYRLVALTFRLADEWKISGPWNKYILRESMRGRIPESVRTRVDKMGFPTAHKDWFAGPWYEPMQDLLASREVAERGLYNVAALRKGLERHRKGEINISQPLLANVAQVELWMRSCATDPLEVAEAGAGRA
ncbi:MAG: asparagine synthase (glutamine-hydrolyzing) [Planctomycetota bacterium]